MIKHVFVVLCAILLAVQVNSIQIKNAESKEIVISPHGLLDDAQTKLEELREIMESTIEIFHFELDRLANDVRDHRYMIMRGGQNMILNAYRAINEELTTIKNLANTATKDISSCLENREDLFNTIPYDYLDQLSECIPTTTPYIDDLLESTKYYVDVVITKVNELEFQLGRCEADSLLCISSIVSQIELQMVQLPQQIQTEVIKASDEFAVIKVVIEDCRNPIVADATSHGNTILADISDCANAIL